MTKLTVTFAILASMLLTGCKKELDPEIPVGALFKMTAQGKLQNNLEYSNGRISRILAYSNCETPYSIVEYGYAGDQITLIRSGTRGLLSSWSGARSELAFRISELHAQTRQTRPAQQSNKREHDSLLFI